MAPTAALPTLTAEPGFPHYLEEIRRFPMLERQEEYMLAKRLARARRPRRCHRLTPVGLIPSLASRRTGAAPAVQPDLSRRSSPASVFR
jgi:hypothetical protein